ncbi:hypothetical protein BH23GEM6_BH23GEM6_24550 [soil metagenome]
MNRTIVWIRRGLAAALLVGFFPALGNSQEPADTLRQQFRLPQPSTFAVDERGRWITPALSVGVPSGFGADFGDAFIGANYQHRTRTFTNRDGAVFFGFGLGDAERLLGLEVAITSFGTVRSCCRGALNAKVHRVIPGDASVAVGVESAATWGVTDGLTSVYAVGTKIFILRPDPGSFLGTLALTAGAGNGRFKTRDDLIEDRQAINPFGSVGVRLMPQASAVTTWTGHDLNVGLSLVPLRNTPLFITPAVVDLTTRPRFVIGAGLGFNYASLF